MASRRARRDTSGRTWPDLLQFLLTAPKKVMARLFQMTLGVITALLVIAVVIVVGVQCLPTTTRMVVGPLEIEKGAEPSPRRGQALTGAHTRDRGHDRSVRLPPLPTSPGRSPVSCGPAEAGDRNARFGSSLHPAVDVAFLITRLIDAATAQAGAEQWAEAKGVGAAWSDARLARLGRVRDLAVGQEALSARRGWWRRW